MNISLYIAEILEDNGELSIPGIGTFYRKKIAGYFDEQAQLFFPPVFQLNFEKYGEDSSVLAEYISKTEDVSIESASDIIKDFASKLNEELENTRSAEIPGIGILKKEGTEFIVETNPSYALQPLPELELVYPYIASTVEPFFEENKEIDAEHLHLDAAETEKIADTNNYIAAAEIEQIIDNNAVPYVDTEEPERTFGKKILIAAIFVLILMGVSIYFFYPQIRGFVQNKWMKDPPIAQQAAPLKPIPQDPADSLAYQKLEKGIATKPADSTNKVKSPAVTPGAVSYEIIVASFNQRNSAEAYIKQLTSKGNKAEAYIKELTSKGRNVHVVEKPSGTFKYEVSVGSFKDMASAQIEKTLAIKNISEETWVDLIR